MTNKDKIIYSFINNIIEDEKDLNKSQESPKLKFDNIQTP